MSTLNGFFLKEKACFRRKLLSLALSVPGSAHGSNMQHASPQATFSPNKQFLSFLTVLKSWNYLLFRTFCSFSTVMSFQYSNTL